MKLLTFSLKDEKMERDRKKKSILHQTSCTQFSLVETYGK